MASKSVTWVVCADGARAHFFATDGGPLAPALDHDLAASTRCHGHDAVTERPGRAFDSAGQGRHAIEPATDRKALEKRRLAKAVAAELETAARSGRFDRLVVAAPPEMLGDLRRELAPSVGRRVVAEIGKDLTHLPAHRLMAHVDDAMRSATD